MLTSSEYSTVSLCVVSFRFPAIFFYVISIVLEQKTFLFKILEISAPGEGSGPALRRILDNFSSR